MFSSTVSRFLRSHHITSTAKLVGLNLQLKYAVPEINSYNAVICRLMAGHSKWQNIRFTKAAKDKEKSNLHGKYSHMIRCAVREKGPDPKNNLKLARFIEAAREHNVPNSVIENAMKKASSGKVKTGLVEILGPGGCYVIVDYETDNISDTRHRIKAICKKYNSSLPSGDGRWRTFYVQKGILKVTQSNDGQALDVDKATDVAIEAGAEDVQLKTSEGGASFLEFYCESADMFNAKKEVEKFYTVEEAYIGFIANITVELSDSDMDAASGLIAELGEISEVIRIYENVQ